MQSRQFSSVSPSMPAIRSMLICGKPSDARVLVGAKISGERCARPFSSRISSLKFSTPRLRRVTPMPRMAASFGFGQRARLALERDLLGLRPRA